MQTFLPYAEFDRTAAVLDDRRLGKQRVETLQILRALTVSGYGWQHHPAVLMWKGYERALLRYGLVICAEWVRRGHSDTCAATMRADAVAAGLLRAAGRLPGRPKLPPWLGTEEFHRSHRSALLRKDPDHYGPLFPDVPPDLSYVWPSRSS